MGMIDSPSILLHNDDAVDVHADRQSGTELDVLAQEAQ